MSNKIKKVIVLIWTAFTPMLPEMISPAKFSHKYDSNPHWKDDLKDGVSEYEYTTTIVFDSLKKAFPEADFKVVCVGDICVSDNLKKLILYKTKELEGRFIQTKNAESQANILRNIILGLCNTEEPTAIVDSDIIFWDRFDDVSDFLYEGYYIPSYEESYSTKVLVHSNVHAAFLKIKNPKLLAKKILDVENKYTSLDVFKPIVINRLGNWEHYDTMAMLYSIFPDQIRKFGREDLSKFIHLYRGSQLDFSTYMMFENNPRSLELSRLYEKIHSHIKNEDCEKLKELWSWYKECQFDSLK